MQSVPSGRAARIAESGCHNDWLVKSAIARKSLLIPLLVFRRLRAIISGHTSKRCKTRIYAGLSTGTPGTGTILPPILTLDTSNFVAFSLIRLTGLVQTLTRPAKSDVSKFAAS